MIAIVTGDLVNSVLVGSKVWMPPLREYLSRQGNTPSSWEIFRGDSFQFQSNPEDAFRKFLLLKSIVRQIAGLDVRVSIGIGVIDYKAERLTESNGTAFVHSGRTFDNMKEKQYLAFCTGNVLIDRPLNLLAQFASLIMDNWSSATAETVQLILENPEWNQQQVAEKLKVNQSAISQSRKRAQLDLLLDFDAFYRTSVTSLTQ